VYYTNIALIAFFIAFYSGMDASHPEI
jgi:hypothetical protein